MEVQVIDLAFAATCSNYPKDTNERVQIKEKKEDGTEEVVNELPSTFVKLLRWYYCHTDTKPKIADFGTVRVEPSDDYSSEVILVRQHVHGRKSAIVGFIEDDLKIPMSTKDRPYWIYPEGHPTASQVPQYVTWNQSDHKTDGFAKFPELFHANESKLYLDDFGIAGRVHLPDPCLCTHVLSQDDLKEKKEEDIPALAIKQHITKCLRKDYGGDTRPDTDRAFIAAPKIPDDRTAMSPSDWANNHPYFQFVPRDGNGRIIMTKDDHATLKTLSLTNAYAEAVRDHPLSAEEVQKIRSLIASRGEMYKKFGYDTSYLWHFKQWSTVEQLKFIVSPPPPRMPMAKKGNRWPRIDLSRHTWALKAARAMLYITNLEPVDAASSKSSKGKSKGKGKGKGKGGAAKGEGKKKEKKDEKESTAVDGADGAIMLLIPLLPAMQNLTDKITPSKSEVSYFQTDAVGGDHKHLVLTKSKDIEGVFCIISDICRIPYEAVISSHKPVYNPDLMVRVMNSVKSSEQAAVRMTKTNFGSFQVE